MLKGNDPFALSFLIFSRQTIYLSVEDGGNDKLYTIPIAGGTPKPLTKNSIGCFSNLAAARNGNVIIASYESSTMPSEIVRIKPSGEYSFVTSLNAEKLKALDLIPAEAVWFTSSRNKKNKKPGGKTCRF